VDEFAVLQAIHAGSCIDALNPQAAHIALAVTAVTVGVCPAVHEAFMRALVQTIAGTAMTLNQGQHSLVSTVCGYAAFNSSHDYCPLTQVSNERMVT
jgi:hypothetical protein